MDLIEAERRYLHLKKLHERGELDDLAFRVEAAKLMVRDDEGSFWMVDPEQDRWYQNQGGGWIEAEPKGAGDGKPAGGRPRPAGRGWRRTLGILATAVFVLAAALVVAVAWPEMFGPPPAPTRTLADRVQVSIASPAPGGTVASGQEVAVEVTLHAEGGLQPVDHVELAVDGQVVASRSVAAAVQAGQTSLPLSLPWRSEALGDRDLGVTARSAAGEMLGEATVRIHVAQAPGETLPEPACTADAALLSHVTVLAGTAFQAGSRLDKVWQVRNTGTCAWGVGYELVQTAGESLGTGGVAAVPSVRAGDLFNLEVTFWAPTETGTYTTAWQLRTPEGVFFGPTLTATIMVERLAKAGEPPAVPGQLRAELGGDGRSVVLTWQDLSDNEDAFRIYRDDVEASIALVPADTTLFVDRTAACGKTYRYSIAAFNAAGPSPFYRTAPVTMPACTVVDTPPAPVETNESIK